MVVSSWLAVEERPVWDEQHTLLSMTGVHEVKVQRALELERAPGAAIMLESRGMPLVQARVTGVGAEVIVAFALSDSDWTERPTFPVFITNLFHWIEPALGQEVEPACMVGMRCALAAPPPGAAWQVIAPDGTHVADIGRRLVGETDGAPERAWRLSGFASPFIPSTDGVFRLVAAGLERLVVVDAAPEATPGLLTDVGSPVIPLVSMSQRPSLREGVIGISLLAIAAAWLVTWRTPQARSGQPLWSGWPWRRRVVIATMHVLTMGALVAAWLDVSLPRSNGQSPTVVVVADSTVLPAAVAQEVENLIADAIGHGPTAVIQIGNPPRLERTFEGSERVAPPGAITFPSANLAPALELAAAALFGRGQGRVLVIAATSTRDPGLEVVASRLEGYGHVVDVRPVPFMLPNEVAIERVAPIGPVQAGAAVELQATVFSASVQDVTVQVLRDEVPWGDVRATLLPGRTQVSFTIVETSPGPVRYEVELLGASDPMPINDRAGVVLQVTPSPRVAIVAREFGWGLLFQQLLAVHGIEADLMSGTEAPRTLAGWLAYDSAVLLNLPAIDLHTEQQQVLHDWVEQYGGGLLMLGGEHTFGPGGYYLTPLDDLSPLSSEVPTERPDVAIVFVLDRSGSMAQAVGPVTRLEIAREATWEAIRLLDPRSQVGIVVFDANATLIHPLRTIERLGAVRRSLDLLVPGGGTSLYPGLVQAYGELRDVEEVQRHILVMTDGLTQAADFDGIMKSIADADITVSAVAIGVGAAYPRLELIARQGGGTFYDTTDFRALPSIMAQEMLLLTSDAVRLGTVEVRWTEQSAPFTKDVMAEPPPLEGLVATTPKPTAAVHLVTADGMPLLASWRYGVGNVTAFASHATGPWSMRWLSEADFPRLWVQAVRWSGSQAFKPGLHTTAVIEGDELVVQVEAINPDGTPEPALRLAGVITPPDGEDRIGGPLEFMLVDRGDGRYIGRTRLTATGQHRVSVAPVDIPAPLWAMSTEELIWLSYPPLFSIELSDTDVMLGLAAVTGGRLLLGTTGIEQGASLTAWQWYSAWRVWLLLAVVLFLATLVARYLSWPWRSRFAKA
jgi:uncharacterized membrane protein